MRRLGAGSEERLGRVVWMSHWAWPSRVCNRRVRYGEDRRMSGPEMPALIPRAKAAALTDGDGASHAVARWRGASHRQERVLCLALDPHVEILLHHIFPADYCPHWSPTDLWHDGRRPTSPIAHLKGEWPGRKQVLDELALWLGKLLAIRLFYCEIS